MTGSNLFYYLIGAISGLFVASVLELLQVVPWEDVRKWIRRYPFKSLIKKYYPRLFWALGWAAIFGIIYVILDV